MTDSFFCHCTSTEGTYHRQIVKCARYSEKYTLMNLIFYKYLEPRKKLTRFAWSKPLQKCWTVVIFGHLSWFLWTKTIISIFYFKDYYSRNKVEKIICWQITLDVTSLTIREKRREEKKSPKLKNCHILIVMKVVEYSYVGVH